MWLTVGRMDLHPLVPGLWTGRGRTHANRHFPRLSARIISSFEAVRYISQHVSILTPASAPCSSPNIRSKSTRLPIAPVSVSSSVHLVVFLRDASVTLVGFCSCSPLVWHR